jgi:probable rRNA maturation factor
MGNETVLPAIVVEISDTQGHLDIDRGALAQLVRRALANEGVPRASISVALVDDATIHEINERHLAHDWPTDVISFCLSDPGDAELEGELVVSAEMAATTARRVGVDPWAELALYVVHGLLHLCGYDDQSAAGRDAMRLRENEILTREGLTYTFPLAGLTEAPETGRESARWAV